MKDLRAAALRGTIWSTIQQIGDRGVRAPLFLVLAHLLEFLTAVATLTALALALPHGVLAATWAYSGALALVLPVQLEIASRALNLDRTSSLGAFGTPLLASLVMLGAVLGLGEILSDGIVGVGRLIVLIPVGCATYAAIVAAMSPSLARRLVADLTTAFRGSP